MKMTFKAIARAAGYHAWQLSPGANAANKWLWRDVLEKDLDGNCLGIERWSVPLDTEYEAYKDCCIKCGLVEITSGGMVGA